MSEQPQRVISLSTWISHEPSGAAPGNGHEKASAWDSTNPFATVLKAQPERVVHPYTDVLHNRE